MTQPDAVQSSATQRWIGIDAQQLLWEQFDDEFFVFNPASGHTHVLNALGAATLQLLTDEPLDAHALLIRLRDQAGAEGGPQLAQALAEHLAQLAAIGLIERAP